MTDTVKGLQNNSGLLALLRGANCNISGDQPLKFVDNIGDSNYLIDYVVLGNASISLTTAKAGVWSGPGATGIPYANNLALAGLNTPSLYIVPPGLTLTNNTIGETVLGSGPIYFNISTPQGTASFCDVYVFGRLMPP